MNYDHFSEGSENDLKYLGTKKVKRAKLNLFRQYPSHFSLHLQSHSSAH